VTGPIPCAVPGCRRHETAGNGLRCRGEYLCVRHWRSIPAEVRRYLKRSRRLAKAEPWADAHRRDMARIWDQCKRIAIVRSLPIREAEDGPAKHVG